MRHRPAIAVIYARRSIAHSGLQAALRQRSTQFLTLAHLNPAFTAVVVDHSQPERAIDLRA